MPAWLTGAVLPAAVGGLVVLGGIALTGNLGGDETVVAPADPTPLPTAAPLAPSQASDGEAPSGAAGSVQSVVAQSSPGVVKVTVGNAETGGRLGSGFLVDRRGRVLTNAHVVDDAKTATVTFDDGTESRAGVLGVDESTDLAVLRLDEVPRDVAPLPLGRSETLVVGDPVVAIGNPFGLERTATTGIVSALKRIITAPNGFEIQNVVQTDAAINEGNSGGALVNIRGQVVGMNTWIAAPTGGSVGLGFAIPINNAKKAIDDFITKGRVEYGWLGVQIGDIQDATTYPGFAKDLKVEGLKGAFVLNTYKGSPADKSVAL